MDHRQHSVITPDNRIMDEKIERSRFSFDQDLSSVVVLRRDSHTLYPTLAKTNQVHRVCLVTLRRLGYNGSETTRVLANGNP